ncbi:MAG: hypothetical protein LBR60_00715 [Fibrobacter sp.]|nr:hypothetical protein [Fibrobacter sp.]
MKMVSLFLLVIALSVFTACDDKGSGGSSGNPNVEISSCGTVDENLKCAVDKLKTSEWDEAVAYYDAAYDQDNNDTRAIIYSTLANLAKISTDPKVASLFKDHLGFTDYPNRLNALFSDRWFTSYPERIRDYYDEDLGEWVYWFRADYHDVVQDGYHYYNHEVSDYVLISTEAIYDSVMLPGIKIPGWIKGGEGSLYDNALLSGKVFGSDAYVFSLLANLLDKNTAGLNNLLDDVIDAVFGASFETAVSRLKQLENRTEDRISLDPYFIEQLDLGDYFDEYDQIGWAEVNAVLSAMFVVKASLEWVASYDLNTNLNWLKFTWVPNTEDFLNRFKAAGKNDMPFNNNFLNARPGKMAIAKADYIRAIQGFQASYASIINSELYPSAVKEAYQTVNGGFTEILKAINEDGKFYIPANPVEGTWPVSKTSDVVATVDFGKFFEEGRFSLSNMFETEGGKPVFYLYVPAEDEYEKLTADNYISLIDQNPSSDLCLNANLSYIAAVLDLGNDLSAFEFFDLELEGEVAKAVFEKYYP